jgi:CHRD domain
MRKTGFVFGLLATVAAGPIAQAAVITYHASLSGVDEVPPVATGGQGSAAINLDTVTKEISWQIDYSGLSGPAAAAHIHCGAEPGANAGVAVALGIVPNLASPLKGTGLMTDAQIADLHTGKCYVNIHTTDNKGGELRGTLVP